MIDGSGAVIIQHTEDLIPGPNNPTVLMLSNPQSKVRFVELLQKKSYCYCLGTESETDQSNQILAQ